jgi:uncharacterized glyoxalase superfamily protein PhnB
MEAAVSHYAEKLGFHVVMTLPQGDYAIVERDDAALHLFTDELHTPTPVSVHIFVRCLDELLEELRSRGAHVTQAIVRQPWGNRDFRVMDSSGNTLKFTEPRE